MLTIRPPFSSVYVCSNKKLRNLPNYFIMNLAVSDFLMAFTQSPIFFINCLYKEWVFGEIGNSPLCLNVSFNSVLLAFHLFKYLRDRTYITYCYCIKKTLHAMYKVYVCMCSFPVGCKMYAFCGALFGIASMINLLAISIDRYLVITKPLQSIHGSSKRRTTLAIIMVWLYSLAWSLAPLVGWSEFP